MEARLGTSQYSQMSVIDVLKVQKSRVGATGHKMDRRKSHSYETIQRNRRW